MVDDHVDNASLECDLLNYSRYNKVVVLYLDCHHKHSENHREGEIEKASPKCLWEPQDVETESQWMNGAVIEQKCHQRLGWRSR